MRGVMAGAFVLLGAGGAHAASLRECWAVSDAVARAACYDQVTGRPEPTGVPQSVAPGAGYARPAPQATGVDPGPARTTPSVPAPRSAEDGSQGDVDTQIISVTPLRHGYFRLELADGSLFNTTVVAAPPPVGTAVHVRRTFMGTTYFDIAGRSPVAVRRSRPR
jgi:hypothetical protein